MMLFASIIQVTQASTISFILSQLYKTKFEIQAIEEDDDDICSFFEPKT